MRRSLRKLNRLEKKLSGHEAEGVEINVKKEHPVSEEIKNLLEYKRRNYLFYSFRFV